MTFDLDFFTEHSEHSYVDPALLMAIAQAESGLDPNTARYEPGWMYHVDVTYWARELRISRDTEKNLQSISWGLMQIMGTVAREMGFDKHLTQMIDPAYNVLIGIRKIEELENKYHTVEDVVSAYNQGSPRKKDGVYRNQKYVNTVMTAYYALK